MKQWHTPIQRKVAILLIMLSCSISNLYSDTFKRHSIFFSSQTLVTLQTNINANEWARQVQQGCIEKAAPWLAFSDDELWSFIFTEKISRSWMVWSDGFCPSCHHDVRMYNWLIDPFKAPWKVQCPHCKEFFPKNDFYAYYLSALDEHFLFDPQKADRSLLFNTEHPDPADSLHQFGVDDGEGYVAGEIRWRFIGAYLIYGQWKKLIIEGIYNLAAAYVMTGDQQYAHKVGILLDRVADVYPAYDYSRQGYTYEKNDPENGTGYVSVWHDACMETRVLALAYDQVFEGIKNDKDLVKFLAAKAKKYKIKNPKSRFEDIQHNIEQRIFRDAAENRDKIESNFPQTDITLILMQTILSWQDQKEHILKNINDMIARATAVDGVSGEKGLASYSANVPQTLAQFLAFYERLDENLIPTLLQNHPNLAKTFRFHIDTWINDEYYPRVGDSGRFGEKVCTYMGAKFSKNPLGESYRDFPFISNFTLFWRLFEITGDTAYVQILYKANENSANGLPYDLLVDHAPEFQHHVSQVIEKSGNQIAVESVNLEDWCLALLRDGQGDDSRVLWLDYDIGGNHCHADGLNIGLFAKGLDILPGFGYPPVQFGGWFSPKAIWYRKTAAHNTVVIDGKDQMINVGLREKQKMKWQLNPLKRHVKGETQLWAIGKEFKAIAVDGKMLFEETPPQQYERTLALIDISATDSYVLSVFRVAGGKDHAMFLHGSLGDLTTNGLSLQPGTDYGHNTQMTNFQTDPAPTPGWFVDWKIKDYYGYLEPNADVHLAYYDATSGISASTADTWIAFGFQGGEAWIKSLVLRKQENKEPTSSTFVGIIEPYKNSSNIRCIERLPLHTADGQLYPDMNVALQINLNNGNRDLLIAMDVDNPLNLLPALTQDSLVFQQDWQIETDAELCLVRMDGEQHVKKIAFANGSVVKLPGIELELNSRAPVMEIDIVEEQVKYLAGAEGLIKNIRVREN